MTVLVAAAVLVLAFPSTGLAAQGQRNLNPGVLPPYSHAYGQTYGEWAAEWWQWAFAIPMEFGVNPILEGPCETNQSGPVWFLAGNFGWSSVRTCCVPAGKALFFPIMNSMWATQDPENEPEELLRELANASIDQVFFLECTVDGVPLENLWAYRAESPAFGWVSPTYGEYPLAVTDGYWIMLAPLSTGEHEIYFAGASEGFALDVTYTLTVGPSGPSDDD